MGDFNLSAVEGKFVSPEMFSHNPAFKYLISRNANPTRTCGFTGRMGATSLTKVMMLCIESVDRFYSELWDRDKPDETRPIKINEAEVDWVYVMQMLGLNVEDKGLYDILLRCVKEADIVGKYPRILDKEK